MRLPVVVLADTVRLPVTLAAPVIAKLPDVVLPVSVVVPVSTVAPLTDKLPVVVLADTAALPVIVGLVSVLFVNVSVVAFPTRVSVPRGNVSVPDPAFVGASIVIEPLVSPDMISDDILYSYRTTQRYPLGIVTVAPPLIVIGPTEDALLPVVNV